MQLIPTQAVPSQQFNVVLGGQACTITLTQLSTGLYILLQVNSVNIVGMVICENLNRIVRDLYLGFIGDLMFIDNTDQNDDPSYAGLGTQFSLLYLEAVDLPAGEG